MAFTFSHQPGEDFFAALDALDADPDMQPSWEEYLSEGRLARAGKTMTTTISPSHSARTRWGSRTRRMEPEVAVATGPSIATAQSRPRKELRQAEGAASFKPVARCLPRRCSVPDHVTGGSSSRPVKDDDRRPLPPPNITTTTSSSSSTPSYSSPPSLSASSPTLPTPAALAPPPGGSHNDSPSAAFDQPDHSSPRPNLAPPTPSTPSPTRPIGGVESLSVPLPSACATASTQSASEQKQQLPPPIVPLSGPSSLNFSRPSTVVSLPPVVPSSLVISTPMMSLSSVTPARPNSMHAHPTPGFQYPNSTNVTTPSSTIEGDISSLEVTSATTAPLQPRKKPRQSRKDVLPRHLRKMRLPFPLADSSAMPAPLAHSLADPSTSIAAGAASEMGKGKGKGTVAGNPPKPKPEKTQSHVNFERSVRKLNSELARAWSGEVEREDQGDALRGCKIYVIWSAQDLILHRELLWLIKMSLLGSEIRTKFDEDDVTHAILADPQKVQPKDVLRRHGYNTVAALPKTVHFVKDTWIDECFKNKTKVPENDHLIFWQQQQTSFLFQNGQSAAAPATHLVSQEFDSSGAVATSTSAIDFSAQQPTYSHRPTLVANAEERLAIALARRADFPLAIAEPSSSRRPPRPRSPRAVSQDSPSSSWERRRESNLVSECTMSGERQPSVSFFRPKQMMADELDEVIAKVQAGEVARNELAEDDSDSDDDPKAAAAFLKRKRREQREANEAAGGAFRCQRSNTGTAVQGPNEFIASELEKIGKIEANRPALSDSDNFRKQSYGKVAGVIRNYPVPIMTYQQACNIRGVGAKTAQKIWEIITTGTSRKLAVLEQDPQNAVARLFTGIYGIGGKRAQELYKRGARTLEDLRSDPRRWGLSATNVIGLDHYADLQQRIPRAEIQSLFDVVQTVVRAIDSTVECTLMGSFRRGALDCGDIDILLTLEYDYASASVDSLMRSSGGVRDFLPCLLKELYARSFLVSDLYVPSDPSANEQVYHGLCRLSPSNRVRRIDFLQVPVEQRGAALIYFTGNDYFNRSIRLLANRKGYSLNQRGLFHGIARDKQKQKVTQGTLVASRTEEEIFEVLGVRWRPPEERIC